MQRRLWPIEIKSILCGCLMVLILVSCTSSGNLSGFSQVEGRYEGHAWSPGGQWLAAESTDTSKLSLFQKTGQLTNELHLGCDLSAGPEDFSWLPDGRLSCFTGNAPPTVELVTLNQRGQVSQKRTIAVSQPAGTIVYALQWNPRHFWLAIITDQTPGEVSPTLYITDLQGHDLLSPLSLVDIDGEVLSWSPDGTTLAIVDHAGTIHLWHVRQDPTGKLQMTKLRQLTAGTASGENIAWSPSSRWIVCRHRTYQSEDYLFLLAADGSGKQVKITSSTTDGQLYSPAWSPDGKQLIVGRVSDGALMSLNIAEVLKEKGVKP